MAGMDAYLPIAEHGMIGDLHSVALVGTEGTIDWFCCPRFDSPSVFAAILDRRKGGFWSVAPIHADYTSKQLYFPDTNVLITRFLTDDGASFLLERVPEDFVPRHRHHDETRRLFDCTVAYWRGWLANSRYRGRWREMVNRSALTLKLLTYQPSGAIVAAPTTSLPEQLGGPRHSDYPDTRTRHSAFSPHTLLRPGLPPQAHPFMARPPGR